MVCLPLLQEMREFYKKSLEEYVKNHPGEWVIIQSGRRGLEAIFYKKRKEFDEEISKYKGRIGATFLTQRIPNLPYDVCEEDQILKFVGESKKKKYVKPIVIRRESLVDIIL